MNEFGFFLDTNFFFFPVALFLNTETNKIANKFRHILVYIHFTLFVIFNEYAHFFFMFMLEKTKKKFKFCFFHFFVQMDFGPDQY